MPSDFYIDTERKTVFTVVAGVMDYAGMMDYMDREEAHPDFRPEFNQFADCYGVTKVELSYDEVRALAGRAVYSPLSRRAILTNDDLLFGSARVYSSLRDINGESGIRIYRQMKDALSWLGLSQEPDSEQFRKLIQGN